MDTIPTAATGAEGVLLLDTKDGLTRRAHDLADLDLHRHAPVDLTVPPRPAEAVLSRSSQSAGLEASGVWREASRATRGTV
jgi:hypothetical protein